jgi:DNA-binding NarL/FixJ family response regulator
MRNSGQARVIVATDRAAAPAAVHAMPAPEFDVVGAVYDADTLLSEALRLEPDVVVVEAALSLRDEFRATREIMRRLPHIKIIHHVSHARATRGGAARAEDVPRDDEFERAGSQRALAQALRLAGTAGRSSADAGEPSAVAASPPAPTAGLTEREREVLGLLASGFAMKVIAHRLGITYRTVAFHKYKMMQRLGIRTNAHLTAYALRTGALQSDHVTGAEFPRRTRHDRAPASPRLRAAG